MAKSPEARTATFEYPKRTPLGFYSKVPPPPRTGVESPHRTDARVWQTARRAVTYNQSLLQKKALDTVVRSTAEEHTVSKRSSVKRRTENMMQSKHTSAIDRNPTRNYKNTSILYCLKQGQERISEPLKRKKDAHMKNVVCLKRIENK